MATLESVPTARGVCARCGAAMPVDAAYCPACGAAVGAAVPPTAAGPVPAGLVARGGAFVLDAVLLSLAMSMALGVASTFAGNRGVTLAGLGLLAAGQLYWAGLESSAWQASLGKRVFRLMVVCNDGARMTFNRALVRSALSIVPLVLTDASALAGAGALAAILVFTLVPGAVLMAAFNTRRLALHDLLTATMVARRPHA